MRTVESNLDNWRSMTAAVHTHGGVIVHQVNADAGVSECRLCEPSDWDPASQFEIVARSAREVGFDGMELSVSRQTSVPRCLCARQVGDEPAIVSAEVGKALRLVDIARQVSQVWKGGGRVGVRIPIAVASDMPTEHAIGLYAALENLKLMYIRIDTPSGTSEDKPIEGKRRRVVRDLRSRFGGAYISSTESPDGLRIGGVGSPDLVAVSQKLLQGDQFKRTIAEIVGNG